MKSGWTPKFRALLHRTDPVISLIAEVVRPHASDVKDTKDEWLAADSLTGLSALDNGGVQLTENTSAAITQGSDDGTETDTIGAIPPFSGLLIEWTGSGAEERELRTLVARLHPRPDGGSPKTVNQWRAQLFRVTERGPEDDRIVVVPISRMVSVAAAGDTASDVTFDFQGWSGGIPRVGAPPTYTQRYEGSQEGHPQTLVRVWALDEDGADATNVAWLSDSTLGASISGSGYHVTHYTFAEGTTEKGGDTVFSLATTVAEMPRFTLNRSSYAAATITFSGSNKPDLGAAPTGSLEVVADGLTPGDSSVSYEVHDGSIWVTCYDGDIIGEDNSAIGGADLSALTPAQTTSIRATLTPSTTTFLTPIVRRLGVRDITKTDLVGVATVKGGGVQVDPRTLKGNIASAELRILKTGEKDYLDYGTQILVANHIGEMEVRVWAGDPTYQYLSRAEWMHLDSFEIEDYKNGNTAHVIKGVSVLRRLRRKIPKFVATSPTEGTRQPAEYLNQTIKAAASDIVDGQVGLPGRFIGPLIEDTTVVSKTIRETDGKDELDRLAYLAGYGVITSQGRVKGVRMMRDDLGADTPVATFLMGEYTPVDIGPGYATRVDEFFVPHSWSEQGQSFSGEVRKYNATAFTRLGGQGLQASDRLDDETAKWIPSDVLATTVAERVPNHFGNGLILWAIRPTFRHPHLEPGDVVVVMTDQFVARSPTSDREVKGPVAGTAIVAARGDFWGNDLLVWVPNMDKNIVPAEGAVTRTNFVTPRIVDAVVKWNKDGTGDVYVNTNDDAGSVRVASSDSAFPDDTAVDAEAAESTDAENSATVTGIGPYVLGDDVYISVKGYETAAGAGAESPLFRFRVKMDRIPKIINAKVKWDPDGTARVTIVANEDTGSVRCADDGTSSPNEATVDAATPAAVDGEYTATITGIGPYDEGDDVWLTIRAYEVDDGTGAKGPLFTQRLVREAGPNFVRIDDVVGRPTGYAGGGIQKWAYGLKLALGPATKSVNITYSFIRRHTAADQPPPSTTYNRSYDIDATSRLSHTLEDGAAAVQEFIIQDDAGSPLYDGDTVVFITPYDDTGGGAGSGNAGPQITFPISMEDEVVQSYSGARVVNGAGAIIEADAVAVSRSLGAERSSATGRPVVGLHFDAVVYGATADGATDDSTALQAAATAAETASGGALAVPHGTYILDGDLDVDRKVDIVGEGSESTVIKGKKTALTSGTATSGASGSLTDSGKSWTVNAYADKWVEITGGTGAGQVRLVSSNTATALSVSPNWHVNPDATSTYKVYTPSRILITGQSRWRHEIRGLTLDGVELIYGPTASDYGNGATLIGCEIKNSYRGIVTRYYTWLHKIIACEIHDCALGVHYDFSTPASGAGAAMRLLGSDVFDCYYGVYVDGVTTDGYDLHITASNLENCNYAALKVSSGSDGVIQITDSHWEQNETYGIDAEGATIFIKGGWAFTLGTTHTAFIKSGTSNRTFISNMRLQWETSKLVELVGGAVIIDSDTIFANNAFFGKDSVAMHNGSSSGGGIYSGGPAYNGRYGKVYAGRVDEETSLPGAGASTTLTTVQGYDKAARTLEFYLDVTAAASASQILRVYLNSGGGYIDATLPVQTGGGHFRIVYVPGSSISMDGVFADSTGAATPIRVQMADGLGASAQKLIDVASVSTSGTEATMVVRHLFEYVH